MRPSAPSRSYCRVKALQFDACVGSGELPVCLGVVVIAVLLPGGDFLEQRLLVGGPPIARHWRDRTLSSASAMSRVVVCQQSLARPTKRGPACRKPLRAERS